MEKNAGQVRQIAISSICVAERIRKENGSLDELAQDIQKHGLLNPITVMEQSDGGYVLIAGLRRMKAMEQLNAAEIRATVMSPMEADEMLMLEIAENEQRKEFTVSEKLAFAERIRMVEVEKGKQRRMRKPVNGQMDSEVGNCPPQTDERNEAGKVREIVAKKVGFSSDRQMRRAKEVAEKRPDLMDRVDKGEQSISGAYRDMQQAEKPKAAAERPRERRLKFTFKEQMEFDTIDDDIASLESQLAECQAAQGQCGSDYVKLQELQAQQEELEARLEEKTERWVYLNELKEKIDAQ